MRFKINIIKKKTIKEAESVQATGLYDEDPLGLVDTPMPDVSPTTGVEGGAVAKAMEAPSTIPATSTYTAPDTTAPSDTSVVSAPASSTPTTPEIDIDHADHADHTDHDHSDGLVEISEIEGINIKTSRNRQYGTVEMRDYLKSLANVGGGNYYIGDISSEHGGEISGHVSHQSGIDADISIPTTGDGQAVSVRGSRWGFRSALRNIDYNRTLAFLRHSAPYSKRILLDRRFFPELKRLAQEEISAGRMRQEEYDRLFVGYRKIVQHVNGHHNHFHVRLNTPGLNDPHSTGRGGSR